MHIVYVTFEFPSDTKKPCGGLGAYLRNMAQIFSGHGHVVTILLLSETTRKYLWKDGIYIQEANFTSYLPEAIFTGAKEEYVKAFTGLEKSYRLNCEIKKINKWKKIDIVQYCNGGAFAYFASRTIPSITRLSNYESYWRNAYLKEFDIKKAENDINIYEKLILKAMKKTDQVIGPSKVIAEVTQRKIHKKVTILESPFYLEREGWDDTIYQEHRKEQYLIFYGALGHLKGIHLIADCIYQILDRYPDLHFVFAGKDMGMFKEDGKKESSVDALKRNAREHVSRVHCYGPLDRELLYPLIQGALACVLPSRIDNLPNTCIEAMAMSKIVIGTYGASFEQLIRHKKSGLLIRRDSREALLKAISYLMQMSGEERAAMGEFARKRTRLLSPERVYKNYKEFYEGIAHKEKRSTKHGSKAL